MNNALQQGQEVSVRFHWWFREEKQKLKLLTTFINKLKPTSEGVVIVQWFNVFVLHLIGVMLNPIDRKNYFNTNVSFSEYFV